MNRARIALLPCVAVLLTTACQDADRLVAPIDEPRIEVSTPALSAEQAEMLGLVLEDALTRVIPAEEVAARGTISSLREQLATADAAALRHGVQASWDALGDSAMPVADVHAVGLALTGIEHALESAN